MSLVVVIKDNGRIVMGADKQGTLGDSKSHTATKVWTVKGYDGCLMGGVGLCRANQVMQYANGLIDRNDFENGKLDINEEYVAMQLAPTIVQYLSACGIELNGNEEDGCKFSALPNSYIFAYKDKAWLIGQDLTVEEIDDYLAIGSGSAVAKGVLFASRDKDPFKRIAMAIEAASIETISVDDSIEVLVTEERKGDEEAFNKAVGDGEIIDLLASQQPKVENGFIADSEVEVINGDYNESSTRNK